MSNSSKKIKEDIKHDGDCDHCCLKDLCKLLGYGNEENGLPEGTLRHNQLLTKGETIYRHGDPFHSLFNVKSGSFMSLVNTDSNASQVLGFRLPGELVGAEGISNENYISTVRALENSKICEIDLNKVQESGLPKESIQKALISILSKEIARDYGIHAALIRQSAGQRLSAFILCISKRLEKHGIPHEEFKLNMSRGDIANYLGLAKESVSRLFAQFQKKEILKVRGKLLILKNIDKLKQIADQG